MTQQMKKPFKDKSFYLDLRFYRYEDELIKNMKKLGANIESFLSRDVNYVVTDKEDFKHRLESWTPATPKSLFSPSSSLNKYDLNLSPFETPSNTSSPANESRTPVLSRGLALVQKAKQMNKGTADIFEVCSQWNIKVIHLQKVLGFIAKCNIYTPKKTNENKPPQKRAVHSGPVFQKLTPPLIKVEDLQCKYRPQYKQFSSLKEIADRKMQQIVQSLQSETFKPSVLMAINVGQLSNVLVSSSVNKCLSPNVQSPHMNATLPDRSVSRPSIRYQSSKLPERSKINKNSNYSQKLPPSKKKVSLKKKKYCEICSCAFVCIDEHLKNERHKRFMNDRRNFKAVEKIIHNLPTVSDFLRKNMILEESVKCSKNSIPVDVAEPSTLLDEPLNLAALDNTRANNGPNQEMEIIQASCPSEYPLEAFPFLDGFQNDNLAEIKSVHSDELQYSVPPSNMENEMEVHDPTIIGHNNLATNGVENCEFLAGEYPDCFKDYKLPQENPLSPCPNQNDHSTYLNHSITVGNTHSSQSPALEHSKAFSRYNGEYSYNDAKNLFLPNDLLATPEKSTPVIRKFPFTNFGFGWNTSFGNNLSPNTRTEDVLSCADCSTDSTEGTEENHYWKNLHSNVNNLCKNFVNDDDDKLGSALDLSVGKSATVDVLVNVESGIAVT